MDRQHRVCFSTPGNIGDTELMLTLAGGEGAPDKEIAQGIIMIILTQSDETSTTTSVLFLASAKPQKFGLKTACSNGD